MKMLICNSILKHKRVKKTKNKNKMVNMLYIYVIRAVGASGLINGFADDAPKLTTQRVKETRCRQNGCHG